MKKTKFIFCFLVILVLISLFFYRHHKPYTVISGEIIYDEFKKGLIEVYWSAELKLGYPIKKGLIYLSRPGPYRLMVPKEDYGDIYICGRNRGLPRESLAYFISDLTRVGKKDIRNFNIVLKTNKLLMDGYKGRTARLSGRILCGRYKKGVIDICVYSPDYYNKVRLPPDIAKIVLSAPGDFSVDVPVNTGKVYVVAVNIPEGENSGNSPDCPKADYGGNPVLVGYEDIDNIDIFIK